MVCGDLIILEAGDRVPADGVIIEQTNLQVDESLLSGESHPVEKQAMNDKKSDETCVYMGTLVKNGKCKAIVDAVGMNTSMGKIANLIQDVEDEFTPLQKRLEKLGKFIILICLIICMVVAVTGILRGEPVIDMLISGITLAVAAVPEGLPAVVTIALAIGVSRMVKKNALVKKLPSVETLGCATVICSDKTGTITQNIMDVRRMYVNSRVVNVNDINKNNVDRFKLAIEIGAICNNARFTTNKNILGDATEVALIKLYTKFFNDYVKLKERHKVIEESPFSSERKCMSVLSEGGNVYIKGAPEVILEKLL